MQAAEMRENFHLPPAAPQPLLRPNPCCAAQTKKSLIHCLSLLLHWLPRLLWSSRRWLQPLLSTH